MSMNLYILKMHIYFTGYDSVQFALRHPAKNDLAGIEWGLMQIPVMVHYPGRYGIVLKFAGSQASKLEAKIAS
jgi:hypothetical protein